jgi:hypothetical protein
MIAGGLAAGCPSASAGRYTVATDPGSRYHFEFIRDRQTGRWVHREFEIRVDLERHLPELKVASEIGNRFSVQLMKPGSASSGGIFSAIPVVEDEFKVWRGADVIGPDDLKGQVAYGVSVSWPQEGKETLVDPMEVFSLPALGDIIPEQWTEWVRADVFRPGAFGWWEHVAGRPAEPLTPPPHPFEFRWRLVFAEIPGRIP